MISIPKGTKDVLPGESYKWHYVEKKIRETARLFGLSEIRTPVFEHTELFLRGVGETTDIVNKEMYTFEDKGGRSLTLKPEGTAGVARSYIENSLSQLPLPLRMYYITPVFRYERPQAGRLREHHQFGVELYGSSSAAADAEVICIAASFFASLGIGSLTLNINSIGCPSCRPKYNEALRAYYKDNLSKMCPTCQSRYEKNPLRMLDCKEEACVEINRGAPAVLDYLCGECQARHAELQSILTKLGIAFKVNPRIVRGLDYYTGTVFEFVSSNIGAQGTVCGGGRYDKMIGEIGGPETPAVGFGMGIERLILTLETLNSTPWTPETSLVYFAPQSGEQQAFCMELTAKARAAGISAECDIMGRGLKSQFKYADKAGFKYVAVIGGSEMESGNAELKNLRGGENISLAINGIIERLSGEEK